MKKILALLLSVLMLLGAMPLSVFAANDYTINSTTSTDDYYNLISKKDWEIAPGITESEIVLNNDDGSQRQVLFVMEADLNNEYVKVINSYTGMVPEYGNYQTGVMSKQAALAEQLGYGNVVGAMNTCLSWYTNYPADRVGEPLGFIMLDAEVLFDPANCGYEYGNVGFPSVLVINKDFDENGNPRPDDIPKVEMPQIKSAADLDGWEDQVIPVSSGYIVKDGVNQAKPNHTDAAPRSVVGIKPDGTVVIMVNDGRQSPYSAGMSMYELAEVMLDLGCTWAVNCDGGGSTTWVSQRPGEELKVNNSPSDGAERPTTTGILFITTAPADGTFARANISAVGTYYTPGSKVEFSAFGTDLVGTPADIPADVTWQLADPSMGTIENGIFVSNGKVGKVTAQMVYGGKVVGEHTIEIVIPTEFSFAQAVMTVPFDKEVTIAFNATINGGLNSVILKAEDVVFSTTNDALGTFNGLKFTSVSEDNAPANLKSVLTATFVHNTELVATAELNLGKGSEVLFDFEDPSDIDGWNIADVNGNDKGFYQNLSYATSINGQVHDGIGSMRVEMNPIAANGISNGGYGQSDLFLDHGIVVENAKSIGFWAYIPDEYEHCWIRVLYWYDSDGNGTYDKKNTISVINQPEVYNTVDESGWRYFSVDVSAYSKILIPGLDCKDIIGYNASKNDANNFRFIEFMFPHTNTNDLWKEYGTINGLQTVYIDNITADFSDAVDDREAPVFGKVELLETEKTTVLEKYVTVTTNSNLITLGTTVKENTAKTNATGLNAASAKAYVDGVEVPVMFSNGRMSINDVAVADGIHRVKFEICDNMGNKSVVIRLIKVASGVDASTIQVVPADPTLNNLYGGSIYWMNMNANKIETIKSVKAVIDLNYGNHFELDNMILAAGFTATYTIDEENNTATIVINRTGENTQVGAATLAQLPIRVIYYDTDINIDGFTAKTYWDEYGFWPYDVKVDVDMGEITYVDGYTSNVLGVFSNEEFSVDTELQAGFSDPAFKADRGTAHVHAPVALDDKAATCTEAGYTGRTYCAVCDSVVDWGTTFEATGHNYVPVGGVYTCEHCGDTQGAVSGLVKDGDVYRYFVDGVAQSGWFMIDIDWYYFESKTLAAHPGKLTIDGVEFEFEETGKLVSGVWVTTLYGMRYYYGPSLYTTGWATIDGNRYYFQDTYRYEGYRMIFKAKTRRWYNFGDDGICRENEVINGFYWDADNGLAYVVDNIGVEGLHKIDGDYYYFNYYGYAVSGFANVGSSYCDMPTGQYYFDEDYKAYTGLVEKNGTTYYYENGRARCAGLVEVNGDLYFAGGAAGEITVGKTIFVWNGNSILPEANYAFGADGKILNGIVEKNGVRYYYLNGQPKMAGLVEIDGDYYFAGGANGEITVGKKVYVWKTNGILPEAEYEFGADGKMLNGIVAKNGTLYYYLNGQPKMAGLVEIDGEYYFAGGAKGEVTVNKTTYVWKDNGIALENANCEFGADGKMLNGIVEKNGTLYYYVMGRPKMAGLINIDGDYYFAGGAKGEITVNKTTYVWKDNGIALENANCEFGADGKMLNGIVEKNGTLYYYVMGRPKMAGLINIDGDYYFAGGAAGEITTGKKIYVWKTNGLLPEATYEFGVDGKMLNGIVEKDGVLYYYLNGQPKMACLVEIDGDYYFAGGANGEISVNKTTYVWNGNGLLPEGNYTFDVDGKMLDGFVTKTDGIYYYENGKPGRVGLNYIDGYYYFVDYSGKLFTNGTYFVWETNGYSIGMKYKFDALGRVILN